jgi:hypothetical protein
MAIMFTQLRAMALARRVKSMRARGPSVACGGKREGASPSDEQRDIISKIWRVENQNLQYRVTF